jgi:nucleotide-binding universal stress UspA family protein
MAYEKAVDLARLTNAEVVILQVAYDIDYYSRKGVLFARKYFNEKEVKSECQNILSEIRKDVNEGDVKITELILMGDPARTIISEARENNYDLIVMGSSGNGTLKGTMIGSVSLQVLTKVNNMVLIVKDPQR